LAHDDLLWQFYSVTIVAVPARSAAVAFRSGKAALVEPHVKKFDITSKPMKGWVLADPEGVEDDDQLKNWTEQALKFLRPLHAM
jgi:hypothetical protein